MTWPPLGHYKCYLIFCCAWGPLSWDFYTGSSLSALQSLTSSLHHLSYVCVGFNGVWADYPHSDHSSSSCFPPSGFWFSCAWSIWFCAFQSHPLPHLWFPIAFGFLPVSLGHLPPSRWSSLRGFWGLLGILALLLQVVAGPAAVLQLLAGPRVDFWLFTGPDVRIQYFIVIWCVLIIPFVSLTLLSPPRYTLSA